jgi:hypothetical protein
MSRNACGRDSICDKAYRPSGYDWPKTKSMYLDYTLPLLIEGDTRNQFVGNCEVLEIETYLAEGKTFGKLEFRVEVRRGSTFRSDFHRPTTALM